MATLFTTEYIRESQGVGVFYGDGNENPGEDAVNGDRKKRSRENAVEDIKAFISDLIDDSSTSSAKTVKERPKKVVYVAGTHRVGKTSAIYRAIDSINEDEEISEEIKDIYVASPQDLFRAFELVEERGYTELLRDIEIIAQINRESKKLIWETLVEAVKERSSKEDSRELLVFVVQSEAPEELNKTLSSLAELDRVLIFKELVEEQEVDISRESFQFGDKIGDRIPDRTKDNVDIGIIPFYREDVEDFFCAMVSGKEFRGEKPNYCKIHSKDRTNGSFQKVRGRKDCAMCRKKILSEVIYQVGCHPGLLQRLCGYMNSRWERDSIPGGRDPETFVQLCLSRTGRDLKKEIEQLVKIVRSTEEEYMTLVDWAQSADQTRSSSDKNVAYLAEQACAYPLSVSQEDSPSSESKQYRIPKKIQEYILTSRERSFLDWMNCEYWKPLMSRFPEANADSPEAVLRKVLFSDRVTTADLCEIINDVPLENSPSLDQLKEGGNPREELLKRVIKERIFCSLVKAIVEKKKK